MTALYGEEVVLESRPTYELKSRLENFLDEISLVCAKYGLLIDPYSQDAGVTVVDLASEKIVGLDFGYFVSEVEPRTITGYDFLAGSVLDGSWLVETTKGLMEQRYVDGRHEISERALRLIREKWMIPDAGIAHEEARGA